MPNPGSGSCRWSDMMRDFGNMKKAYLELLAKKQESSLATSLERQQQGAQFRIIDPPSLAGQAVVPRPLQVLAGCDWRSGWYLRCCSESARNSWMTVFAANRPWRRLPTCRSWWRFRRCRPQAEIRRARWRPWIAAVAATVRWSSCIPLGSCLRLLLGIVNV